MIFAKTALATGIGCAAALLATQPCGAAPASSASDSAPQAATLSPAMLSPAAPVVGDQVGAPARLIVSHTALLLPVPGAGDAPVESASPASSLGASGFEMKYALRRTFQGSSLTHDRTRLPSLTVSTWRMAQGNTFSLASNVELPQTTRPGRIFETEFFAAHQVRHGNLRIEPSFSFYLRDRSFGRTTGEAGLSIGQRKGALRWFADGFVDVLRQRGNYLVQTGLSHRFTPDDHSLVKTSLLFGRSSERSDSDFGRLTDASNYLTLSASLTRDVSSHLAVRPNVQATRFLSGDTHVFFRFGLALEWNA